MAETTKVTSGAGLRRVQVYLLDTDGYPDGDQSGVSGYDGVEISGANAHEYTVPQFQRVTHIAKDRVVAVDSLPPTEAMSYTITSGKQDLDVDAILGGTKVTTYGEAQVGGLGTDKRGSEPDVCTLVYRQALNTAPGATNLRRWQLSVYPTGRLIPMGGAGATGEGEAQQYQGYPGIAASSPWGVAFTEATNGFLSTEMLRIHSDYPFMIERFDAVSGSLEYTLQHTPISSAKAYATLDGAAETVASVNTGAKSATITSSPSGGEVLVIGYETSDSI
jgi:hypothetical protein